MRWKILVVEDYNDTREFMRMMLEHLGYRVLEAQTGLEAVDVAEAEHPDLILMDIALPGLDGYAATQLIRQRKEIAETPIIAVTAHTQDVQAKALKAGCNHVFRKPIDFSDLTNLLSNYLQ